MKRLSIGLVGNWSLFLIVLSLFYFFKPSTTLSAQTIYVTVGLLGAFIYMDLKSQKHRILQLEKRIDDLENSTNS